MNISARPTNKLTPRHHRIALLRANALTQNKICELTGYTPAWVSSMLADPRMQALVAQYQGDITSAHIEEASTILTRETVPTLRKVLAHRDGDDPRASLTACGMILDRTMPAKQLREEDRTIKIIVEQHEMVKITRAEDEMKIVNAQARLIDEIPPPPAA